MNDETKDVVGGICKGWWDHAVNGDTGYARTTRAKLRRADTPLAVLGVEAVHKLNRSLANAGFDLRSRKDGPDRLSLIAVALAHVKEHGTPTAARRFGVGDPKTLGAIRFDTVIRAETPRDLIRPLVQALAIIRGNANVRQLGSDLYWWNEPVRMNWCFDYYGATDAKPDLETEGTQE